MEVKQFPIFSIILFKLDDLMHDSIMESNGGKLRITITMIIFGTIGVVRRYIPYSSAMISFFRGFIAALILLVLRLISNKKSDKEDIRRNLLPLIVSGAMIGVNWILLFEAYRFTTIAVATISYYMAPVFTIIASTFILKERMTIRKAVCVAVALIGIVFVACIVCTALPYSLYFSAIQVVKAQTAALLSYIDPIVAVLLSALFLKEKMSTLTLIGIILVIGSALISETSKENMNE